MKKKQRRRKVVVYYGGTVSSPYVKDYDVLIEHREKIKKELLLITDVSVIDPFESEKIGKIKTRELLFKSVKKYKGELARDDLWGVERSDIVLLEIPHVSIGVVSEMAFAFFYNKFHKRFFGSVNVSKKYIIVVSSDCFILNHNFVLLFADWRCKTIEDALERVKKVVDKIKRKRLWEG